MPSLIRGRVYYGWILVPVGCICYGLGIAPTYGSWGFFAPELADELGLSLTDVGSVFGFFSLCLLAVSPLTGVLIKRLGLRITITFGALLAALGLWRLSRAGSLADCYLSYSVLAGLGLAFSTAFPMQTLATFWFKKYRARALGIILAGGTGVGAVIAPINAVLLEWGGWRFAWQVYAGVSLFVAVLAAIFIRNTPEECGLAPDGIAEPARDSILAANSAGSPPKARDMILTWQFALLSLCALGQLGPWTAFTAHGRSHLKILGVAASGAAIVLSSKNIASTIGRLLGMGADFIAPRKLLSLALLCEGLGFAGIAVADQAAMSVLSAVLFGLGYGAAMLCVSLTFAEIFGREAFVTTSGASKVVQGGFNFGVPIAAGAMADRFGDYTSAFLCLSGLSALGALGVQFCRPLSRTLPPSEQSSSVPLAPAGQSTATEASSTAT